MESLTALRVFLQNAINSNGIGATVTVSVGDENFRLPVIALWNRVSGMDIESKMRDAILSCQDVGSQTVRSEVIYAVLAENRC